MNNMNEEASQENNNEEKESLASLDPAEILDDVRNFQNLNEQSLGFHEEDQIPAFEKLKEKHKEELVKLGLELEAAESDSIVTKGEEKYKEIKIYIHIIDSEQFLEYLSSLSVETITASQKNSIRYLLWEFIGNISKKYDFSDSDDDRMLSLLSILGKVNKRVRHLDPESNTLVEPNKILENYQIAINGKYLKEYIAAAEAGILPDQEEYRPRNWHFDTTNIWFKIKWDRAIAAVEGLSKKPGAKELLLKCTNLLERSLRGAKTHIRKNPKSFDKHDPSGSHEDVSAEEFRIVIDNAYSVIKQIENDNKE